MTLSELIENGKAKGKLTTKEITDFIEEMDFEVEQVDKLYDILKFPLKNYLCLCCGYSFGRGGYYPPERLFYFFAFLILSM